MAKLTKEQKVFNATGDGQKAMCARAIRLATLHMMNEAIRKVIPNEAYDRALIDSLPDSSIDSMRDSILADYNRIIGTK